MGSKVIPYLACARADQALEFYKRAFGAVENLRLPEPDGKVSHAEIQIDGAVLYISDEYPEGDVRAPTTIGGSPVMIVLEVDNVDEVFNQAVAAGARIDRPLQDSFNGMLRTGKLTDPFGHRWMILTHFGKLAVG